MHVNWEMIQGVERHVDRKGVLWGRWPRYRLVVDGVDLGEIRRTVSVGRDGLTGRRQARADAWAIHGTECTSQFEAEQRLIERALRFGYLRGGERS